MATERPVRQIAGRSSGGRLNRRSFVAGLGTLAVTMAAGVQCRTRPAASRSSWPLGVQLYTLRAELERNFEQTLDVVAGLGFSEVEFAGYFGRAAPVVRSSLQQAGLDAPAGHFPLESLDDWDQTLEFAAAVGHRYVVIPWIPRQRRASAQQYRELAREFNAAGARGLRSGIRFAYHNQEYDFARVDGMIPLDILLERTDPELVDFELDAYWMVKGNQDPLRYLGNWPGRFPMLHLKDSSGAPDHRMMDVGGGSIDWPAILTAGSQAGVRHLFVEHDEPPSAVASIEASVRYLRSLRLAAPR